MSFYIAYNIYLVSFFTSELAHEIIYVLCLA